MWQLTICRGWRIKKKRENTYANAENFPDEQLFHMRASNLSWFTDYVNFLVGQVLQVDILPQQKKKFLLDVTHYYWDDSFLFRKCSDKMIRWCVIEKEMLDILYHCYSLNYGGGHRATMKMLQFRFYQPTLFKDAHSFVMQCARCQKK